MTIKRICLLLASAALLLGAMSGQAQEQPQRQLKVFCVGNSFTKNSTRYLTQIVEASGNQITFDIASIGGATFERHLMAARAHEANPDDPKGKPYRKSKTDEHGKSLKEMLLADAWDVVTIQQGSASSFKAETYRPHAAELCEYIRKYAPKAEIVIHQTWAYREGFRVLVENKITHVEMYDRLKAAYYGLGDELKLRIMPVGDAFWIAYQDPDLKLKIHSSSDGGWHAAPHGEYLGGLVWLEVLYGVSCVGNTFEHKGITLDERQALQAVARQAAAAAKERNARIKSPPAQTEE